MTISYFKKTHETFKWFQTITKSKHHWNLIISLKPKVDKNLKQLNSCKAESFTWITVKRTRSTTVQWRSGPNCWLHTMLEVPRTFMKLRNIISANENFVILQWYKKALRSHTGGWVVESIHCLKHLTIIYFTLSWF